MRKSGIDAYSVQVPAGQAREAIWRAEGPADGPPLAHEGGVFRRFTDGFRYDSEA